MKRHAPLLWFLGSLLIFNLNLRSIPTGDSVPASLLPFSVVLDHQLNLDRFYPTYREQATSPAALGMFHRTDRHVYSLFPIGLPLLLVPFYAPLIVLLRMKDWQTEAIITCAAGLEKLVASAIAALSVSLFYLLVRRLTSRRWAVVLTGLFAFAGPTWSISSQALWMHGGMVLFVVAGLACFHHLTEGDAPIGYGLLFGLCVGLAVAIRPTGVSFWLAGYAGILLLRKRWRIAIAYSVFPLVIGSLVAVYNYRVFGDIRGVYGAIQDWQTSHPIWGLAVILFSPNRGLFVFAPFFLFLPLAAWCWWQARPHWCPPLYLVCLVFTALHLMIVARQYDCYGGTCWGPRYLTDIIPCLLVLLIPVLPRLEASWRAKTLFGGLCGIAVGIQGIGVFCYPAGFWDVDHPLPEHPAEAWNWRDNAIVRTASAGLWTEPYVQLFSAHRYAVNPIWTSWSSGFYGLEKRGPWEWRWCGQTGELTLENRSPYAQTVVVEMLCASLRPEPCCLRIEGPSFREEQSIDPSGTFCSWRMSLPSGRHTVRFQCDAPATMVPGDSRPLAFRVLNPRVLPPP